VGEVSIDDTMEALVKGVSIINSGESDRVVDRSREYARSYTWSSVVEKLYDVISE
jgi:hypothetical protein